MADHQRASLGQSAQIGQFYDGRQDRFMAQRMTDSDIPPDSLRVTKSPSQIIKVSCSGRLVERLLLLGIHTNLAASILARLTPVGGHASCLMLRSQSTAFPTGTIYFKISTESLSVFIPGIKPSNLSIKSFCSKNNTHMVTGIQYGMGIVLDVRMGSSAVSSDEQELEKNLQSLGHFMSKKLPFPDSSLIESSHDDAPSVVVTRYFQDATFSIWTDIDDLTHVENITLAQLLETRSGISDWLAASEHGRGLPLCYSLMPLDQLQNFVKVDLVVQNVIGQPDPTSASHWIHAFQDIFTVQEDARAFISECEARSSYSAAPSEKNYTVTKLKEMLGHSERFMHAFQGALRALRGSQRAPDVLNKVATDYYASNVAPQRITDMIQDARRNFDFHDEVLKLGGQCLNYADALKAVSVGSNLYILWHTNTTMKDDSTWSLCLNSVMNLLRRNPGDYIVAVAECLPHELSGQTPALTFYRQREAIIPNLLDCPDTSHAFARCDRGVIDESGCHRPRDRRLLHIPCPHRTCEAQGDQNWHCYHCRALLEHHDQHFYCECGRAPFGSFEWQCAGRDHGGCFHAYPITVLEEKLRQLEAYEEVNILLLGETGVGKSTFINALYNYMLSPTLDEALDSTESGHIEHLIPCSFMVQQEDDNSPDGELIEHTVSIGSDSNEVDGTGGNSATQSTTVHAIRSGNKKIRLIDTPGIGDTRGVDMDAQNMANILRTLSKIPKLDGIIILLKPNSTRLTLMFRFCVSELLGSLHRDAARNIVWGFTNTRQSNYLPGDSLKPLRTLIAEHKDLGLEVGRKSTTYCFDSEGFRYLAARKVANVTLPNLDDFRRSWAHSAGETRRLLEHVSASQPHQVQSTLSLNNAREAIAQLTRPLADVTDTLERTIDLSQEKLQELENMDFRGKELRASLHFQEVQISVSELDQPRTVCTDAHCVEYKTVGGTYRQIYKSICHEGCNLRDPKQDTVGDPRLIFCAAMHQDGDSTGYCQFCQHHWMSHMHIWYEQVEEAATFIDENVEAQLANNADDVALKKAAVRALNKRIKESRRQQKELRDAMCQFALFLKEKSIRPYNDAMIAYMDHIIKQEQETIQYLRSQKQDCDKNEKRLSNLNRQKKAYEERIKILEEGMGKTGNAELLDASGVDDLIQKLYGLPKIGPCLEKIHKMINCTEMNEVQEQEHRPKSKFWRSMNFITGAFSRESTSGPPRQRNGHDRNPVESAVVMYQHPGTKRTAPEHTETEREGTPAHKRKMLSFAGSFWQI